MIALTLEELAERIVQIQNPLILTHTRPDGDTLGSAAALMHIYESFGIKAHLLSPDPIPRRLMHLFDHLDTAPPNAAIPYTAISVDVASLGQLGSLKERFSEPGAIALMIDHHDKGEQFADYYTKPNASAVGEIIYDLIVYMLNKGILKHANQPMLSAVFAAISSDTGCFKYSNATARTHRAAAHLIELGVDAAEINHKLFDVKSAEMIRAEGYVQANLEVHPSGRIATIIITKQIRDSLGLADEHFETAIDMVRQLEGVEVAIAVKECPDGRYKVSLRSLGLDVSAIAASLGGGGHIRAAGCSIATETAEIAANLVICRIAEALGL